jgi:hypothetical protein
VRPFDQKFGADFLAGVPHEPGVYRIYDSAGGLGDQEACPYA